MHRRQMWLHDKLPDNHGSDAHHGSGAALHFGVVADVIPNVIPAKQAVGWAPTHATCTRIDLLTNLWYAFRKKVSDAQKHIHLAW